MPSIFDIVNAKEIATYYNEVPSNSTPYLGATLFPSKKQLGLDLSWFKGSKGLPVALMPSEFDTKATLRDRIGFGKIVTEMPFFREAMRIGEKERQELNKLAAANNTDIIMPLIEQIYDDVGNLVAGAEVQAERMRMQLLSTGKIAIVANGLAYNYDYKFDTDHKDTLLSTAMWSDTDDSTPVDDIRGWQDIIEDDTGNRPTKAICTRKTLNYLIANDSIRNDIDRIGGSNIIMDETLLKEYFAKKLNLRIAVYNKKFSLEGVATSFFPDDVFTLLPDGNMGSTYFGTTPEESDLMSGGTDAITDIVNTGVAITTIKEPHPVNVQTIVSAIELPSFEMIDSVFIAKVHSS